MRPLPLSVLGGAIGLRLLRAAAAGLTLACGLAASCHLAPRHDDSMQQPDTKTPLSGARLCGFAATTDAARAREFYGQQLGLRLVAEDQLALVFDLDGQMLRVQKLREHRPQPFTVLGWNVTDLSAHVEALERAGVACMRIEGFGQDAQGIVTFPDGTRLAWLKDPDGNVLSLAQFPR